MTPHLFDHIAFILLAAVFPVWDYFAIRRRAARIRAGEPEARLGLYRIFIVEEWATTIVLLAAWFALGRDASSLGLVPRPGLLAWAGYGLTAVICAALVFQAVTIVRNPKSLANVRDKLTSLSFLFPGTPRERRMFDAVSVTAGICEEIFFRGYVVVYLMAVFGTPFWAAGLISSLVFGFAHVYQGPTGILRTGFVGLMFFVLYALTGSLWAPMIAHAVMDITSGRIGYAAGTRPPTPSASPAGSPLQAAASD